MTEQVLFPPFMVIFLWVIIYWNWPDFLVRAVARKRITPQAAATYLQSLPRYLSWIALEKFGLSNVRPEAWVTKIEQQPPKSSGLILTTLEIGLSPIILLTITVQADTLGWLIYDAVWWLISLVSITTLLWYRRHIIRRLQQHTTD